LKLTIGLLSEAKHQTLGTFLLHLDCDVLSSQNLTEFLSAAVTQTYHIVFMDKNFLKSEQDYHSMRAYMSKLSDSKRPRLICLDGDTRITRVPNSGSISSADFSVVKNVLDESLKLLNKAGRQPRSEAEVVVFDDEAEVVELSDEEATDSKAEMQTEAFLNVKKAQSLDELGVNLVWSLNRIVAPGRKGIYFKYLPTYCSLVALGGFNFKSKKVNGVGLNFSSSKDFNASQHLQKLMHVPAFLKVVERLFEHTDVVVRTFECDGEAKGVVVYEKPPGGSSDIEVFSLCDYAEAKLCSIVYKYKYIQNKRNDEITGCILKEGFFDQLQNEVMRAKRVLLPVTVMLFELDHFYGIKTKYNQERVRTLVRSFARILQDNVRHNDLVGQFGESKFAILFPHMSTEDATIKAQKMNKSIAQTKFFSDMKKGLICSASVAIGTYPTQVSSADHLMVSLDSLLSHKESAGSLMILNPKPGFVKDFEEMKLPDSAMNRKRSTQNES
jgi:diguanylate cyclase (GGDEF)-like protein